MATAPKSDKIGTAAGFISGIIFILMGILKIGAEHFPPSKAFPPPAGKTFHVRRRLVRSGRLSVQRVERRIGVRNGYKDPYMSTAFHS